MNRARIERCHGCWAEHGVGPDGTPVTKPGQKWVVTDVGSDNSIATLHDPDCPHLPGNEVLRPGAAPTPKGSTP